MLKSPKQTKYRKYQQMPMKKTAAVRSTQLNFGQYGLQVNETKFISAQQIEICRRNLRRIIARKTSIWIRSFPYRPTFAKDAGQRMGKGKGERTGWVCPVRKGQIILEVGPEVSISIVRKAFRLITFQLGVSTTLIEKNNLIAK